jgi:hypothetical protein
MQDPGLKRSELVDHDFIHTLEMICSLNGRLGNRPIEVMEEVGAIASPPTISARCKRVAWALGRSLKPSTSRA